MEDAKLFLEGWFRWYNTKHRHSGIQMLCPQDVHEGRANEVLGRRQQVMDAAYKANPHRFSKGCSKISKLVGKVWINKPQAA